MLSVLTLQNKIIKNKVYCTNFTYIQNIIGKYTYDSIEHLYDIGIERFNSIENIDINNEDYKYTVDAVCTLLKAYYEDIDNSLYDKLVKIISIILCKNTQSKINELQLLYDSISRMVNQGRLFELKVGLAYLCENNNYNFIKSVTMYFTYCSTQYSEFDDGKLTEIFYVIWNTIEAYSIDSSTEINKVVNSICVRYDNKINLSDVNKLKHELVKLDNYDFIEILDLARLLYIDVNFDTIVSLLSMSNNFINCFMKSFTDVINCTKYPEVIINMDSDTLLEINKVELYELVYVCYQIISSLIDMEYADKFLCQFMDKHNMSYSMNKPIKYDYDKYVKDCDNVNKYLYKYLRGYDVAYKSNIVKLLVNIEYCFSNTKYIAESILINPFTNRLLTLLSKQHISIEQIYAFYVIFRLPKLVLSKKRELLGKHIFSENNNSFVKINPEDIFNDIRKEQL